MLAFVIGLAIVIGIAAGVAVFFVLKNLAYQKMIRSLGTGLYLIKIPHGATGDKGSSEGGDFKTELAHFEQLLGGLTSIKKPFIFELAVPHFGEEIHFYLVVPKFAT